MTTDTIQDIVDLWTAVYGEPPSITTDRDLMLASLIGGLGQMRVGAHAVDPIPAPQPAES
jgi:hypothetical protein